VEVGSALVAHRELVAEAAVDDTTGEAICAFVVLKRPCPTGEEAKRIAKELREWVAKVYCCGPRTEFMARAMACASCSRV
jgi:acetyl-CoA synthetase